MMSSTPKWEDKSLWFHDLNEAYGSFAALPEAQKKVDELIKGKKDRNGENRRIDPLGSR